MENQFPIFENIWLADDDPDDREIFEDAITQILPKVSLTMFSSGEEVLSLIDSGKLPDILFLDINMPCSGFDCLQEIRDKRKLRKLPVIIFSSSVHPNDIVVSYGLGANLFYKKPSSFSQLIAGLQYLFQMNWNDPYTITSNHYINNKFVPFVLPK
jgi:CheY-like chemotaxis protein